MRYALSAAILALALTACGSGDDSESGEEEAPAKVDLGAAAEACTDQVQDSLNEATNNRDGAREELSPETVMRVGDGGDTVTVAPLQQVDFLIEPSVAAGLCLLDELEAPDAVRSTVSQATGLSGQQETDWEGVDLTYAYNGNVGFSGVFTVAD